MVEVTLFRNMRKDVNSTERPDGTNTDRSTVYACALFDPCSVQSPRIWIASPEMADMHDYNYAYIPHFSRYYWVTDLSFTDGRWLFSLSCDVLATYKYQIGASEQYVLRSESEYNEDITDTLYTPTGGRAEGFTSITSPFSPNLSNGTFVIGYSSASPTVGSNNYAAMTAGQLTTFLSILMGSGSYLNLNTDELSLETAKLILNPLQYIQSVKFFPFTITGGSPSTYLWVGWWLITASVSHADLQYNLTREITMTLPIEKHPQAATMGAYLNKEPYTQYRLLLPVLGYVDLPASLLYGFNGLRVKYTVDLVTGQAEIDITAYESGGDRECDIYHTSCQLAVDIPVAQIMVDTIGAGKSAVNTIAGGISAVLGGGISGLINGAIDTAVKMVTPIPSFMGSAGNFNAYTVRPRLSCLTQEVTGPAFNLFGRPLCEKRVINTLSGFTMCGKAHLALEGATRAEIEEAERYLNEGLRYE